MPSSSPKQQHFMHMVKAVQAGEGMPDVSPATQRKLRKAAASMTRSQVADFAHLAKKGGKG